MMCQGKMKNRNRWFKKDIHIGSFFLSAAKPSDLGTLGAVLVLVVVG